MWLIVCVARETAKDALFARGKQDAFREGTVMDLSRHLSSSNRHDAQAHVFSHARQSGVNFWPHSTVEVQVPQRLSKGASKQRIS